MKKASDDFLIAHIELEKARFSHEEDIGVEFHNEIDAWRKMEDIFRHQIKTLRECKTLENKPPRRRKSKKSDLKTLVYTMRGNSEKFD